LPALDIWNPRVDGLMYAFCTRVATLQMFEHRWLPQLAQRWHEPGPPPLSARDSRESVTAEL
jgi:hypothetical protein